MEIFDTNLIIKRKSLKNPKFLEADFLKQEVGLRLLERLDDVKINFEQTLNIGTGLNEVYEILKKSPKIFDIKEIQEPEEAYSLADNSFNLVVAVLSLQFVNNPSLVFKNIHRILKPGGLIIGALPIAGTLENLQQALLKTEMELFKGFSPRVHPFSDVKTIGNTIQSVGFTQIITDADSLEIMYKSLKSLITDIRKFSANNALIKRNNKYLGKAFLKKLEANFDEYKEQETQHIPIRFEFCNFMAWKK
jgi:NADH dehydrogenase [ubiquinone] 1 alpha subcomplex assembly factor 5